MTDIAAPFLELTGISKRYGGVRALENVDLTCRQGSIHAILGENGAGKSTLIKIVSGVVQPDSGTIRLSGSEVTFPNPPAANRAGIVCIFQELSLMPDLSVADNICIADPPRRFGLIDRRAQRRRAEELLARVGCEDVSPLERVKNLPLSRRQMVEIAKALGKRPRLLILDEATSALTSADVEKVYTILHQLRDEGLSLLYISHRMHEIEALADACSVFRNGRHIETFKKGQRNEEEIVQLMIGREWAHVYPPKPQRNARAQTVLEAKELRWGARLNGVSLQVGKGEIVGLGGLDGQGQRELLLALFGVLRNLEGLVRIDGQEARVKSPAAAKDRRYGMALIPEDRKTEGLMLPMSVADNLGMAALGSLTRGILIDRTREREAIQRMVEKLRIKVGNVSDAVATLSGGNQQKVVIAKWLMTDPRLILLNDPTRGIDVGTKQELYQLLRDLADAGAAILLYTTDYDELIGLCDRVLILYDGAVVRELEGAEITETNIIASSLNLPLLPEPAPVAHMRDLQLRIGQNLGVGLALLLFLIFWLTYNALHPKGFSPDVLVQNSNEAFVIGMVAMAQTVPVIMGGLDLSVGATMTLVNCLASVLLDGTPLQIVLGMVACLLTGLAAGFINGCVVVYGRIQPIIATLATGAIYIGLALFLRPTPGGDVNEDLAWAMSNDLRELAATFGLAEDGAAAWLQPIGWLPVALVIAVLVVVLVWIPFRNSVTGRGVYAVGSAEGAAYMSGLHVQRSKLAAFTLAGFFAGVGGLYLALQTSSGNADVPQAAAYTLNSIAAVVIGGTSLMGGSGGAIGSLVGALVIRAISFNFRIFDVAPLLQPLFEGLVLLAAVSLGAGRTFRVKNRLELLG